MKRIATVAGKIILLGIVFGNVTRLLSKYSYVVIKSSRSWNDHAYLNVEAISELKFWKNNVSKLNGIHCGHPNRNPPELCILSDAYDVVCGSFIPFKSRVFRQSWSDAERRSLCTAARSPKKKNRRGATLLSDFFFFRKVGGCTQAKRRCSTTYRELSVVLFSLEAFSKN